MIKCRVYMKSEGGGFIYDENVFVEIQLPCLPPLNSPLVLGESKRKKLEEMARSSAEVGRNYFPYHYPRYKYRDQQFGDFKEEYLPDLSFEEFGSVEYITFLADKDYVQILMRGPD